VRLEQRLDFRIETRTEELMRGALRLLERVSGDRIRHELALILAEMQPLRALARLERLGVLALIHPELRVDDWVRGAFYATCYARQHPPWPSLASFDNWMLTTFSLFTSRLSPDELNALGTRLQFSRVYLDALQDARAAIALLPDLSQAQPPSRVVDLLSPLDEVGWLAAWAAAPNVVARNYIARFAGEWRFITPTLNGRDLQRITGLPPGPIYGELLRRLRRAWLDDEIATASEEEALLRQLVEQIDKH
jgi:tRNA nucleotidyltransferase (CCA-adding enzyme)